MKKLLLPFFISFIILPNNIFSQAFHINHIPADKFNIDKFAQEVYYRDVFTYYFIKKNLISQKIDTTSYFYSPPVFANKSHKSVHFSGGSVILHDHDKDTSYVLFYPPYTNENKGGTYITYGFLFSPNDSFLLFQPAELKYTAFKLSDSTFHKINMPAFEDYFIHWSSDSTVIFKWDNQSKILEYYLYSGKIDTLINLPEYPPIISFAYNKNKNILIYSTGELYPKLYLYNKETDSTTIVFNILTDDPNPCVGSGLIFNFLKWYLDDNKLAFFCTLTTNNGGAIYVYNLKENKTYRYTTCEYEGKKYELDWINRDTIIYLDQTYFNIDGFALLTPVSVEEKNNSKLDEGAEIGVYPNPFNPSTTIKWHSSSSNYSTIKVFDILGKEIAVLFDKDLSAGQHQIEFNAEEYKLSSGVYFINIEIWNSGSEVYTENKKVILMK